MKTTQVEKLPFYGEKLPDEINHGDYHHQTAYLRKPLKRNKVPWECDSLSGKFTLNKRLIKDSPKTTTKYQKKKHLPYIEVVVPSTKNGKNLHIKEVWIG